MGLRCPMPFLEKPWPDWCLRKGAPGSLCPAVLLSLPWSFLFGPLRPCPPCQPQGKLHSGWPSIPGLSPGQLVSLQAAVLSPASHTPHPSIPLTTSALVYAAHVWPLMVHSLPCPGPRVSTPVVGLPGQHRQLSPEAARTADSSTTGSQRPVHFTEFERSSIVTSR